MKNKGFVIRNLYLHPSLSYCSSLWLRENSRVTKVWLLLYQSYVNDGSSLREASRLYNVPVETLRWRVTGAVDLSCKPGPSTVLTPESVCLNMQLKWQIRGSDETCVCYSVKVRATSSLSQWDGWTRLDGEIQKASSNFSLNWGHCMII